MLRPMSAVIDVQHVTRDYGGRPAVDNVSLAIEEGEIFAILGPAAPARPRSSMSAACA